MEWSDSGGLALHAEEESRRTLNAYASQPNLILEHVGIEESIFSGGYGKRQVFELVQNAADAIQTAGISGRITVILTSDALYCANEGAPIDSDGVTAILHAHLSRKGGAEIGHFGLGFKSVLNVTSTPQFFCKAGSFGFDHARSLDRIRSVVPDASRIPVLRLAHALNVRREAAQDPVLAELMEWATTVVRLPRNRSASSWLPEELSTFPGNFLIFSPHVKQVDLIDQVATKNRRILIDRDDVIVTLREGDEASAWAVLETKVVTEALTLEELEDAEPSTRKRPQLPLAWAVPSDAYRSKGRFWAFFPTETETTLSGILNAPWKTNADRQNLLNGPFNLRLIREFASLVSGSWNELTVSEDPGSLLDLLPSRQRDDKNWADGALGFDVFDALSRVPSVPDGFSQLCLPSKLKLRPELISRERCRAWLDAHPRCEGDRAIDWVHPSLETRERRPRVERLGTPVGSLTDWISDVASSGTVSACKRALSLIGEILSETGGADVEGQIRKSACILTQRGELVVPDSDLTYIGSDDTDQRFAWVHRSVSGDPDTLKVLRTLGIRELDTDAQLRNEIKKPEADWEFAWQLLRKLNQEDAIAFVEEFRKDIKVRTRDRQFKKPSHVLLPGEIVDSGSEEDTTLTVDHDFHQFDLGLLKMAGVVERPSAGYDISTEEWFSRYLHEGRQQYHAIENRGNISDSRPETFPSCPGPLHALTVGSKSVKKKLTAALLLQLPEQSHWLFFYPARRHKYKKVDVIEPVRWALRRFGYFETSAGICDCRLVVSPQLGKWDGLLPVAPISTELARHLSLAEALGQLSDEQWKFAFGRVFETRDHVVTWDFYAHAAPVRRKPETLLAMVSGVLQESSTATVCVTDDEDRFVLLQDAGVPSIQVRDRNAVDALTAHWGLTEGTALAEFEPSGPEEPLVDALPGIAPYLTHATATSISLQRCASLVIQVTGPDGLRQRESDFARQGNTFCYREPVQISVLLDFVVRELKLALTHDQCVEVINYLDRAQRRNLTEAIRAESSLPRKLLVAVGAQSIRRQLPPKVAKAAIDGRPAEDPELVLSEAAIAVFGVELFSHFSRELSDAGLEPPHSWNGERRAQDFCEELGFPAEFAGFARTSLSAMHEVDGPIELLPLHDFQQAIADRIQSFFLKGTPDRGLLSLPTGAGKTRVVVEAIIRATAKGQVANTIVWVAESEELCEQAVFAWTQAWRAIGPPRRLRVSRLWGSNNNKVRDTTDTHVVVATFQSLRSRVEWPEYNWLQKALCIVVDEAHGSTSRSFTEILQSFGISARETARHLIGITATPFRGSGRDEQETKWLASRYGNNRFDHGVMPDEDPYLFLQSRGILANVDHNVLEGGDLTLSAEEREHFDQYNELPPSAEQRLGNDDDRNSRLITAVEALDPYWPVLLFALSVEHANLVAAQLSLGGIAARAISGRTALGARRHYISQFKAGNIRVLTNFGVLTTGFDAPAVRALIIARPVYSRGLYQQMIGRGLRGPMNGGKDRCLIVNVQDNIAQFGTKLAFRDFEHLWRAWQD